MHLHILPEAKLSSKTVVGNLLYYLVLNFGFLKRIHGALEVAEFTSNFIRKLLNNMSHNCLLSIDQKGKQPTQLTILRILLISVWLCLMWSRHICSEGGEGVVILLRFMWKSLKHTQWRCISLTFKLWIYLWGPWSLCWEKENSRRKKLLNPHENVWKIWWGGREHRSPQCSPLVRSLSERAGSDKLMLLGW